VVAHVSLIKAEQAPLSQPTSPGQFTPPYQPALPQQPIYVDRQEMPATKFQPIPDNRGIQVIRGTKTENIPIN